LKTPSPQDNIVLFLFFFSRTKGHDAAENVDQICSADFETMYKCYEKFRDEWEEAGGSDAHSW
jgi:hypothetical protein